VLLLLQWRLQLLWSSTKQERNGVADLRAVGGRGRRGGSIGSSRGWQRRLVSTQLEQQRQRSSGSRVAAGSSDRVAAVMRLDHQGAAVRL